MGDRQRGSPGPGGPPAKGVHFRNDTAATIELAGRTRISIAPTAADFNGTNGTPDFTLGPGDSMLWPAGPDDRVWALPSIPVSVWASEVFGEMPPPGVDHAQVSLASGASMTISGVQPGAGAADLGKQVDVASTGADIGIAALARRVDTPATITPAVNDYTQLTVDSKGRQWIASGVAAEDIGKAADAVAGSTDTGVASLAVRTDSPASAAANGDYVQLITDSLRRLWTRVIFGTGAGDPGKAVGDAAGATDVGVAMLRVRKDDPTVAETPVAGAYVLARSSRNGRDWVSNPLIADAALPLVSGTLNPGTPAESDAILNGYACGDLVISFGGGGTLTTLTITIIPIVNGVAAEGSAIVVVLSSVSSSTLARVFRVEGGRNYRLRLTPTGGSAITATANMVPLR